MYPRPVAVAVSLLLAATLSLAGIAKLRDPEPFRRTLRTVVPASIARVVAAVLPPVELVLAVLLVAGVGGRLVAGIVLLLMLGFTVALWLVERRAADAGQALVSCNCFGAGGDGDPATGRVRNLLLAVAAATLVAWPAEAVWDVAVGQVVGAACVVVGAVCVWQLALSLQRLHALGASS